MGLNSKSVSGVNDLGGWDQNANFEQPKLVIKRQHQQQQQQQQQQQMEKLKCPRCDSANTKFCYYNNYNKEQPRHFCKTCKRHWTKGGTLRNVPEGGGRKNKRPRTSISPARSSNPINSISSVFNPASESINQKSEPHNFPFSFDDPKTLVPVDPYQDLFPSSSKSGSIFLGSTSSTTNQNIYPNFLSSSFSFDGNPCSVSSSSFQQSNSAYNYIGGNEATEDSMPMTSSNNIVDQSLDVPVPTSCVMEMQSWWNWDDIDAFVSADFNNAPWINDSEIHS